MPEVIAGCGKSASSAAEADVENKAGIAAVNRCATQNQVHRRFPQPVPATLFEAEEEGFFNRPLASGDCPEPRWFDDFPRAP